MSVSRFKFSVKPQEAILILITMFWGGTFLAVQYAVTLSDPFFFVGLRFATAALAVGLISLKTLRGLTLKELKAGVAIGVAIAMGYSLQTWGLQTISSSKSAFITAMYVPLVPLLQWLCLGRLPGLMSCIGIVLAFIGLILLAGPENNLLALGQGEIITLIGGDCHCGGDYSDQRLGGQGRRQTGDGGAARHGLAGGLCDDGAGRGVRAADVHRPGRGGAGARYLQRHYPGHHELGAAQRIANASNGHLHRRAGLGRDFWATRRGTSAAAGPGGRGVYCRRGAGERVEAQKASEPGERHDC